MQSHERRGLFVRPGRITKDIRFTFKVTKDESIFQPSKVLRMPLKLERIIININEISKLGDYR